MVKRGKKQEVWIERLYLVSLIHNIIYVFLSAAAKDQLGKSFGGEVLKTDLSPEAKPCQNRSRRETDLF